MFRKSLVTTAVVAVASAKLDGDKDWVGQKIFKLVFKEGLIRRQRFRVKEKKKFAGGWKYRIQSRWDDTGKEGEWCYDDDLYAPEDTYVKGLPPHDPGCVVL